MVVKTVDPLGGTNPMIVAVHCSPIAIRGTAFAPKMKMKGRARIGTCDVAIGIDSAKDLIVATEGYFDPGDASRCRVNVGPIALLERNTALGESQVRERQQKGQQPQLEKQRL